MRRTRIRSVSKKRQRENRERKKALRDAFGENPRCYLCAPLRARGVVTGCSGWAQMSST